MPPAHDDSRTSGGAWVNGPVIDIVPNKLAAHSYRISSGGGHEIMEIMMNSWFL